MLVDYVQYGPVTPDDMQLGVFKVSVRAKMNSLVADGAVGIEVSSSVHPFIDEANRIRVIYFSQISYEQSAAKDRG